MYLSHLEQGREIQMWFCNPSQALIMEAVKVQVWRASELLGLSVVGERGAAGVGVCGCVWVCVGLQGGALGW